MVERGAVAKRRRWSIKAIANEKKDILTRSIVPDLLLIEFIFPSFQYF
jgi:hypothetical protein